MEERGSPFKYNPKWKAEKMAYELYRALGPDRKPKENKDCYIVEERLSLNGKTTREWVGCTTGFIVEGVSNSKSKLYKKRTHYQVMFADKNENEGKLYMLLGRIVLPLKSDTVFLAKRGVVIDLNEKIENMRINVEKWYKLDTIEDEDWFTHDMTGFHKIDDWTHIHVIGPAAVGLSNNKTFLENSGFMRCVEGKKFRMNEKTEIEEFDNRIACPAVCNVIIGKPNHIDVGSKKIIWKPFCYSMEVNERNAPEGVKESAPKGVKESEQVSVAPLQECGNGLCKRKETEEKRAITEINILKDLKHENIMTVGCWKDNFIMYNEEKGCDKIHYNDEATAKNKGFAQGLVAGVKYLHNNGIVHRNICLENTNISNGKLKIFGFGIAKRIDDRDRCKTFFSGIRYPAPEYLRRTPYGKSVDVWATGKTIIELLRGTEEIDDLVDIEYKKAVTGCLKENPDVRFTATELYDTLNPNIWRQVGEFVNQVSSSMSPILDESGQSKRVDGRREDFRPGW